MKNRDNRILLVIFAVFLAVALPMIAIPVDIGEHNYTGGIYDTGTGEQLEAVTVTLCGKRLYALGRDRFDLDGRIVIEAETFQNDSDFGMYFDESLGGWTYGWCSFGPSNYNWNGYSNVDFAYRESYSAVILSLKKDGRTFYLSAVEDEASQTPQEALTGFLAAMGWV